MNCPKHNEVELEKMYVDVYWCEECQRAWLIHKLSSYKTRLEAFGVPPKG